MMSPRVPGQEAAARKGWLRARKWLLLRRASQLSILGLFLLGPLAGIWIVQGSFSASMTLKVLPLTDPLATLQSLIAGHAIPMTTFLGTMVVAVFYLLVGGRVYCSWACPVNMVTDAAAWLNRKLDQAKGLGISTTIRYWLLGFILLAAGLTGSIVWEWLNPVTILQRGLLFGLGLGWIVIAAVFIFDLLVVRRGWCGHLCPVGALYSLLGFFSLLRVKAAGRGRCTDCMDCFAVCPEPHVIRPALKGAEDSPTAILSGNCTNCGRCVDICPEDVFQFAKRF